MTLETGELLRPFVTPKLQILTPLSHQFWQVDAVLIALIRAPDAGTTCHVKEGRS